MTAMGCVFFIPPVYVVTDGLYLVSMGAFFGLRLWNSLYIEMADFSLRGSGTEYRGRATGVYIYGCARIEWSGALSLSIQDLL